MLFYNNLAKSQKAFLTKLFHGGQQLNCQMRSVTLPFFYNPATTVLPHIAPGQL